MRTLNLYKGYGRNNREDLCSQVFTVGQHLLQGSHRKTLGQDKATHRQVWWNILVKKEKTFEFLR